MWDSEGYRYCEDGYAASAQNLVPQDFVTEPPKEQGEQHKMHLNKQAERCRMRQTLLYCPTDS